jgi:hypothetical protein
MGVAASGACDLDADAANPEAALPSVGNASAGVAMLSS